MKEKTKSKLKIQDIILDKTLLKLIPNFIKPTYLTVLRIILTPLIAYLILKIDNLPLVIISFFLVSFTDMIDGAMARTRDQITNLGKALDPVADKLLFLSCAALLIPKHGAMVIFILILILEVITMLTSLTLMKGRDIGANIFGKIKLNLQLLGLLMFIIMDHTENRIFLYIGNTVLSISIILGIISYIGILRKPNNNEAG